MGHRPHIAWHSQRRRIAATSLTQPTSLSCSALVSESEALRLPQSAMGRGFLRLRRTAATPGLGPAT
eukprot:8191746-Pyramimonas_sp.AAC.1